MIAHLAALCARLESEDIGGGDERNDQRADERVLARRLMHVAYVLYTEYTDGHVLTGIRCHVLTGIYASVYLLARRLMHHAAWWVYADAVY